MKKLSLTTALVFSLSAFAHAEKAEQPSLDLLLNELAQTAVKAADAAAASPAGQDVLRDSAMLLRGLASAIDPDDFKDIDNMTIGDLRKNVSKSANNVEQAFDQHSPDMQKVAKIAAVIGAAVGKRAGDVSDTAISELKMTGFLILQEALSQNDELQKELAEELSKIK